MGWLLAFVAYKPAAAIIYGAAFSQFSTNDDGRLINQLLRGLDAHALDLTGLLAERRRFLAQVGHRLTAQSLDRREPQRRHPILLTVLAQSAADVLDEVIGLFDQAVSARESRARTKMRDALAARAAAYRRKIARQLNKGESLHSLRRDLHTPTRAKSVNGSWPGRASRHGA